MKPGDGSMYFIELVQMFHEDIRSAMRDLAIALELPTVDYTDIREHHAKIKRIVTSVGASALNLPLEVLRLGVAASSKEECDFALLRIHQEYHKLRPHLESITELERRIVDLVRHLARRGNN
ncbi:uncharacterized protein LOC115673322 [Syzygium oleosum]|uniref:uncharacterized protein LOC115673322 n=1 Tax=Syzygium oleosum TaxID=219896 RepID=UPI0011D2AC73|nr:uncharacterized protein LOC115673322 [Syzygium oleosum]